MDSNHQPLVITHIRYFIPFALVIGLPFRFRLHPDESIQLTLSPQLICQTTIIRNFLKKVTKFGWRTGLEPATIRTTIWCSTNWTTSTICQESQTWTGGLLRPRQAEYQLSYFLNQRTLSGMWGSNPRNVLPLHTHWFPRPAASTSRSIPDKNKNPHSFEWGSV